jgi:hypothetical protein
MRDQLRRGWTGRYVPPENKPGSMVVLVIGTMRIQVCSVQAFAKAGFTVEQIREEYPTLTAADIRAAIAAPDVAA